MGPRPPSAKPTIEGGLGTVKNVGRAEYDFRIAPESVRGQSTFLNWRWAFASVEAAVPAAIKRVRRRHACRYSDGA
jgi:hypothetical protein